jgi:hypothetical protein
MHRCRVATFTVVGGLVLSGSVAAQQTPSPPDVPAHVEVHRDLRYLPDDHERHTLNVYVPKSADTPLPLVVWVHGRGEMAGYKANRLTGGSRAEEFLNAESRTRIVEYVFRTLKHR